MIDSIAEEDPFTTTSESTSPMDRMRSRLDEFQIDGNLDVSPSSTNPINIREEDADSEEQKLMEQNKILVEDAENGTEADGNS
jgi:hypothetical protein